MSLLSSKKAFVVFLCALILALSLILVYSNQGLRYLQQLQVEKEELERANRELAEENRRLLLKIDRIKKDPRLIEDEARKKLGLVKPDETIYRLREEPESPADAQESKP
jgi:cell division protein FtsB